MNFLRTYTYGPFQSRRLGLSLGVNILPKYKLCTFNCVYCEIGTTDKLVSPKFRIKSPPSLKFRKELKDILKFFPHLSSITFGYNGEPTLNENLLDFHKIAFDVREEMEWTVNKPILTLFTNSSTLFLPEIREKVKQFDLVLAKLDTVTDEDFLRTNSPHPETPAIKTIIDSLIKLKQEMPIDHKLAIQSLIYNSYKDDFISNNNAENISKLAQAIKKIKPDLVQIYSIARIPANYFVFSVDEERKKEIVEILKKIVNDKNIEITYY
jgi:wyosine [tRNA(Phe)-imidazoG37] synthetase (radical SAM superfamily)